MSGTAHLARAKINLALHVTGQREDGYHLLDSLVVFSMDVVDRLWIEEGPRLSISVSGPFAPGVPCDARNLVWRAAELCGWTGAIHLEKNIPHGAGIGGGSSDAAALLRALGSSDDGLALGADVPVCRMGVAARMSGIGETVLPLNAPFPAFFAVLVNPGCHVPTPAVFRALTTKDNAPLDPPPDDPTSHGSDWIAYLSEQRNDLEPPACAFAPVIGEALGALKKTPDVLLTRMSGSGATCFALYPTADASRAAAQEVSARHPDWWVTATILS